MFSLVHLGTCKECLPTSYTVYSQTKMYSDTFNISHIITVYSL